MGLKGQRIQQIVDELNGEKIDVVLWDPDPAVFIANALSPAQVLSVDLDEAQKTASVVVPEKMLSLAIGKVGQNARLAAKLTGWRIDIRSATTPSMEEEPGVDEEELARRAAAALRAEAATGAQTAPEDSYQPAAVSENGASVREERRKVRPNNTVVYRNIEYGPLPEPLAGENVRVRIMGDMLEVRTDSGRVVATYPLQEPAEVASVEEEA